MRDNQPNAPRVATLREHDGSVLGFAILQRKPNYIETAYKEANAPCVELFRAASMTPIIGWLDKFYGSNHATA